MWRLISIGRKIAEKKMTKKCCRQIRIYSDQVVFLLLIWMILFISLAHKQSPFYIRYYQSK